jgi:hypothetical protein
MNNKNRYYYYLNEASNINKNKVNHYNEMTGKQWAVAIGTVLFLDQWGRNLERAEAERKANAKTQTSSNSYSYTPRVDTYIPDPLPTPPTKTATKKAVGYIVNFIMDDLKNNQNIESVNVDEKIKSIRDETIDFIVGKEKEKKHTAGTFIGKAILVVKNFFTDNLDKVVKKIYDVLIDKDKKIHEKYMSLKTKNYADDKINAELNSFIYNKFEENEINGNSISKITQAWREINLNSNFDKAIKKDSVKDFIKKINSMSNNKIIKDFEEMEIEKNGKIDNQNGFGLEDNKETILKQVHLASNVEELLNQYEQVKTDLKNAGYSGDKIINQFIKDYKTINPAKGENIRWFYENFINKNTKIKRIFNS